MKKSRTRHSAAYPQENPESIAALASGMADDFNNILTTVMGACTLIDKVEPANGELLQCVALIRNSAEHAAALSGRLVLAGKHQPKIGRKGGKPHDFDAAAISVRDKKADNDIVSTNKHSDGALS